MREFRAAIGTAVLALLLAVVTPACALAANDPCPRPAQGSVITNPPDLYSENGVLNVTLDYYTTVDEWGRTLYCYDTPEGQEAPTLHLDPGDTLELTLTNREQGDLPSVVETVAGKSDVCGAFYQTQLSVNLHFHGLNVSPKCHSDDVIKTLVNPGESFNYTVRIPADEPPGLYWYRAHVHGMQSSAVEGGASGVIEIEGIGNLQHAVDGLPQRFLVIRDQPLQNPPNNNNNNGNTVPYRDVSLNFVPVPYPRYTPGVIRMRAGAQEFWRMVNGSANTITDLQLLYDGAAQPLRIVAFDGVPIGSGDGRHHGRIITRTDVLIPPGGRVEFIITGPSVTVNRAVLMTKYIDTGGGAVDTARPLAQIQLTTDERKIPRPVLPIAGEVGGDRFSALDDSMVTAHRKLYFAESVGTDKHNPGGGSVYYICVVGQQCLAYLPDNRPAITTHRGAVEDWTIENRTRKLQEFHMHQIHFQLLAIDGKPVPPGERQWYDTYQVGYWTGTGKHPSITVRMDFRGPVVGEFVYESELLQHADNGMMANIRVLPR